MAVSSTIQASPVATSVAHTKFMHSLVLSTFLLFGCSIGVASAQTQGQDRNSSGTAGATSEPEAMPTSKTKLLGGINALGIACVSTGLIPQSTQLPTRVEEVKKGSLAFYAGVKVGDRILQASIDNSELKLKIERNGHIYLATMHAKMDSRLPTTLNGKVDLATILKSYQIRLIVDRSGSMYRPLGGSDKLRWTWVKEELNRFCSKVQSQTNSRFDLYLFNNEVDISTDQSAQQIKNSLANAVTTGSTDLPAALRAATSSSPKPILIILITDGHAVSSKENGAILAANLSRTGVLRRSRVVFLQAGYSAEGANFISTLNSFLPSRGVGKQAHTVLFEEASNKGIYGALEPLLSQ